MIISRRRVGLVEIEKIKDGGENDVRFLWIECVIRGGRGGIRALSECFFDLKDWSFNCKSHLCIVKCTWKPIIITTVFRNIYYYYTLLYLSQWIILHVTNFKRKYLHMLKKYFHCWSFIFSTLMFGFNSSSLVIFIWIISFLFFASNYR